MSIAKVTEAAKKNDSMKKNYSGPHQKNHINARTIASYPLICSSAIWLYFALSA